jgi:hypothetical protein
VVVVAACPGGHERRAREQVTLVVVARPVGQDEVLHGIDAAADTGNEVVCLRPDAKRSPAVEAAARLQCRDAFPQWPRGDQPVRPEQVTVQIQLNLRHAVDLCDHPRPVQLDQRTHERAEPDQSSSSRSANPTSAFMAAALA